MSKEKPIHHYPQTQSLELTTHEAVGDAWTLFFSEARRLAALARQRRAQKEATAQETDDTKERA